MSSWLVCVCVCVCVFSVACGMQLRLFCTCAEYMHSRMHACGCLDRIVISSVWCVTHSYMQNKNKGVAASEARVCVCPTRPPPAPLLSLGAGVRFLWRCQPLRQRSDAHGKSTSVLLVDDAVAKERGKISSLSPHLPPFLPASLPPSLADSLIFNAISTLHQSVPTSEFVQGCKVAPCTFLKEFLVLM